MHPPGWASMRSMNAARSSGPQPSVKSSSSWSTMSTASGCAARSAASSASSGCAPGRVTIASATCVATPASGNRRLAAPGRADDRDEPVRPQQLGATRHDVFAPEEQIGVVARERREAGVRAAGGVGWRSDAFGDHGNEVVGPFDAAQLVRSEREELDARGWRHADHGRRRCRQQHLTGAGKVAYPRRAIHGRAAGPRRRR